jgi:hypothetical protein
VLVVVGEHEDQAPHAEGRALPPVTVLR